MIEIYETPYGNVEINVDAQRAILSLSSGFDSALMLYMVALAAKKYNPELEIYPITARRMNSQTPAHLKELFERVDNYKNAVNVVNYVRTIFPDLKINDNILYDAYFWQYCQNDPIMGKKHTYIMAQRILHAYVRSLPMNVESIDKFKYGIVSFNGVTKNPDFELGGENPETSRNLKIPSTNEASLSVHRKSKSFPLILDQEPFRNGDKRVTFWLADQLGILNTLLDVTRSCEGDRNLTNNWTEECHHCWWCYERTWASETYKNQQEAEQEKYKSTTYFNSLKDRS